MLQKSVYPIIIGCDTETTGVKPYKHGLIEIGAIVIDKNGKELDVFQSYCNPGDVEYSQEALDINHITREQIAEAPPIREVLLKFVSFMNKYLDNRFKPATVVGNNFGFDSGFLQYAFDKHIPELEKQTKWMFRRTDELKGIARTVFPNKEHMSQDKLGNLLNIYNTDAHSALGDIRQMLAIYLKLMTINYGRIVAKYNLDGDNLK